MGSSACLKFLVTKVHTVTRMVVTTTDLDTDSVRCELLRRSFQHTSICLPPHTGIDGSELAFSACTCGSNPSPITDQEKSIHQAWCG